MDLESVMCELAGTSNTSIVPLLSLEKEQFMCQVRNFCKQTKTETKTQRGKTKYKKSNSLARAHFTCQVSGKKGSWLSRPVTGKVHPPPSMCNATS